jgi:cytochrome c peroxidase
MKRLGIVLALLAVVFGVVYAVHRLQGGGPATAESAAAEFTAEELEKILQHSPLGDPPRDPTNAFFENADAAVLGQRFFFDPGFSADGKVSCATCHSPDRGLGDGRSLPERFPVDRNVPSLWNAAYNRWFFWDGRVDSLWSQALKPLENPREHATTRLQVVHRVAETPVLRAGYERVFGALPDFSDARRFPRAGGPGVLPAGSPLHAAWASMVDADRAAVDRVFANVGKAIAAYERKLVSRRSPFDVFVEGVRARDEARMAALSAEARRGLKLFVGKANCRFCHSGPNFTDGEFHNIGIPPLRGGMTASRFEAIDTVQKDPFNTRGVFSDDRAAGAQKLDFLPKLQDTWGQIKTPTLRNTAKTAPYMHQGQFGSLHDVVNFYSTLDGMVQAGHSERFILAPLRLMPGEIASIVAFLESLTDEAVDPALLKAPE